MISGILNFLEANRHRLPLDQYGATGPLSSVVITPRFQASSHVLFLISSGDQPAPVLVAKIPRLATATAGIEREVDNLRMVQTLRPEGFTSIPQVVAFEEYYGYPLLVETALVGQPLDPAAMRLHPEQRCAQVTEWLTTMQWAQATTAKNTDWFTQMVEKPIAYFAERFPVSAEESALLAHTQALTAPLRTMKLPCVFEHGDFSHPNVMLLSDGQPGVVDWELAEPNGLPAADLFFFLTYVGFALANARSTGHYLPAFCATFFGQPKAKQRGHTHSTWAATSINQYAQRLQLPVTAIKPLFVLTWLRYIVGLLTRLGHTQASAQRFGPETATWLRQNRYYALWRYTVDHADELVI